MDRARKEELVALLHQTFQNTAILVVTEQSGLTVAEASELRRRMREAGATFRVTKNRLVRLALKGTKYEGLSDLFSGPTAIAFSDDPLAAAKVSVNFANENEKLAIKGGALDGEILDVAGVKALAALPSLDELRAKIISLIQTPATRLAAVLQAPGGQVARVLSAYGAKGGDA